MKKKKIFHISSHVSYSSTYFLSNFVHLPLILLINAYYILFDTLLYHSLGCLLLHIYIFSGLKLYIVPLPSTLTGYLSKYSNRFYNLIYPTNSSNNTTVCYALSYPSNHIPLFPYFTLYIHFNSLS